MTLFTISIIIFVLYTLIIGLKYGILPSLSDSYYALGKRGWIFQVMLGTVSFLMMLSLLDATYGKGFQIFAFLTTVPLIFVAAAPKFKNPTGKSIESGVHGKSAMLSAISSLILVLCYGILYNPIAYITVIIGVGFAGLGYYANEGKNRLYWAEYACFIWLFLLRYIVYYYNL